MRAIHVLLSIGLSVAAAALMAGCASDGGGEGHHHAHGDDDHAHTHLPRRVVPDGAGAPLFNDLGSFERRISTGSELAQRYFSQGLVLAYGFNHAEAYRAFKEASRQDPSCAICAWGEAYVLGPNINKPMDPADVPTAWEASRRAVSLADGASPVERALVMALAERYAQDPGDDRSLLDAAYADAMTQVAEDFPDDNDVQTLYAESLMDTMPWDYWIDPETPKPATRQVLGALERVIAADPEHVGALHLYIHAVEPSAEPGKAESAADRLAPLSPGSGHLVHMPSHIYLRVGRYNDASVANEKAAAADESYITQCRAQGFYPAVYYPHNVHFLYAAAAFEGRSEVSIGAARKLASNITPQVVSEVPIAEEFAPMEIYALARFGRWEEIDALNAPPQEWRYATGAWHYGRGMADAARGDLSGAREELGRVKAIAGEPVLALPFASGSTGEQLLRIASLVLEARIAGEEGRWSDAVPLLAEAVGIQDALPYTEPPPWYFPNREALGHALLQAGRPEEAERVFAKQLEYTPRNGWSLFGLAASQRAQEKRDAAAATEAQRAEVWQRADVELEAAVF